MLETSFEMRNALRPWVLAARPATLPAAVAPVLVGSATAAHLGAFHLPAALASLWVALWIQIGTNLANDVYDFLHGSDPPHRLGPPRVTAAGLLTPRQVLLGAYTAFTLAALGGLYLVTLRGWILVPVGLACVLAGLLYTGGPAPLGYRGLGDLLVFVFFGLVAVVGTDYVQTGILRARPAAAAVPVGLLCTAILVVNNLRDLETDRASGKRTLAVRFGRTGTRMEYLLCLLGTFAAPAWMRAFGWLGEFYWLPWLALPWAASLVHFVWTQEGVALNHALRGTARLHLAHAALLGAALLA
ncbi:MAG: 1,4-dihydroxy-2-naphthoate polyprenyltransferase [Armatimonadota bacterium]|nr:1,4-dihydroxy-2-naphthoate polyprenyltransferase [Armatimonadota bacterium]MDR7569929.1 1,4-dihydroxy-2-naphthoate polyprenyltransferase [Armatimonadota bacterium]MDR7613740.1 1,4-dihydroxy-2-naphthoate polyprenyltransferase [Armatimonadota bacterium]